jgi:hypothetical protein
MKLDDRLLIYFLAEEYNTSLSKVHLAIDARSPHRIIVTIESEENINFFSIDEEDHEVQKIFKENGLYTENGFIHRRVIKQYPCKPVKYEKSCDTCTQKQTMKHYDEDDGETWESVECIHKGDDVGDMHIYAFGCSNPTLCPYYERK